MTEEAKQRKKDYIKKYQKETYTNISFKLRTKDDVAIIDFLKRCKNKSEFIKAALKKSLGL